MVAEAVVEPNVAAVDLDMRAMLEGAAAVLVLAVLVALIYAE